MRRIDFSSTADKQRHDTLAGLAEHLTQLNTRLGTLTVAHDRAALERQSQTLIADIDRLVFQLYELKDDDARLLLGQSIK